MTAASKPELRIDPLTGLKVVLAPQRADRPFSFDASSAHERAADECPLDEGKEDQTPPEVWALRPGGGAPDTPGWLVRAVPNKYPVLANDGVTAELDDPLLEGRGDPQLHVATLASGFHEVIVHCPDHLGSLIDLGVEQLSHVLGAWAARLDAHSDSAYVHVMVNEGASAGASLEHTHAQLYALDFVPAAVAREREHFTAHNTRTMGGCLVCDLVQSEVADRERLVAVDDDMVLLAPYASRGPFELRIVPRAHQKNFSESAADAAPMLDLALRKLRDQLGALPPFNLWVRTAPAGVDHFHWHLDLLPRMTITAGFELGTGVNINIYPPERAAAELRGE